MEKSTILFADNNPDFLSTCKEFLENAGYRVVTAANPTQARQVLKEKHIDLAILDLRLQNDNDGRDESGLWLAKEVVSFVPKIILTGFPATESARAALRPDMGLSVAVDYLGKDEGPDALLNAVRKALMPKDIFIVHGRDEVAKLEVTRFVEQLGLRAVILAEQPNAGRAIIEKLEEDTTGVAFAVALLTPDDVGGLREEPDQLKPRARQNVIFELGYFIGKLGRHKVGVLYKAGVEIPSNYHGVSYILMDTGRGWKLDLAKEIKQAGVDVDLNRLP
jgi:predicted nucleotide-binding protein